MINIQLLGLAAALVVCAILAKVFTGKAEKAGKSQKAEIMKQLLALSESENKRSKTASSVPKPSPSKQPTRPTSQAPRLQTAARKIPTKLPQPLRSNK
jgi:hypothetical protein